MTALKRFLEKTVQQYLKGWQIQNAYKIKRQFFFKGDTLTIDDLTGSVQLHDYQTLHIMYID
jgi:uncharacterized protein YxjI